VADLRPFARHLRHQRCRHGYVPASIADIQVIANQVANVTLALDPKEVVPDIPKDCTITVSQINRKSFKVQLCMKLQSISFNTRIPTELIEVELDTEGRKWLNSWQDWLAKQYEKQNIEFSTPRVLLNASSVIGGGPRRFPVDKTLLVKSKTLEVQGKTFDVQEKFVRQPPIKELKTTTRTFEFIPIEEVKVIPPPPGLAIFGKVVIPLTVNPVD